MRFEPRVGDRPAGAVRGDGADCWVMRVLRLLKRADLGWRMVRGLEAVVEGSEENLGVASLVIGVAALVRMKLPDGLKKSLVKSLLPSAPLGRLEKRVGSTFSKSSVSTSEALRLMEATGRAARG